MQNLHLLGGPGELPLGPPNTEHSAQDTKKNLLKSQVSEDFS